jgi:hypothetical protein
VTVRTGHKLATIAAIATFTVGCGGSAGTDNYARDGSSPSAPAVSEKEAVAVLDQLTAAAPGKSSTSFCRKFAYQVEACERMWEEAAADCLKPGTKPYVRRSAAVRDTPHSDGGRVLEVEGRTAAGQRYVSEVFVTAPDGTPKASVGVYWSGSGLANSPFNGGHKVLPKPECDN